MLGGRRVWVGMSRGRFVGGRNVKAPYRGEREGKERGERKMK
jgi:hypothetical protein